MIIKESPKESGHESALVKAAAWTWYQRGSCFNQTTIRECDYTISKDIVTCPSRYKLEAMKNAQENTRVPTQYFHKSMLSTNHVGSSLLDVYEIERISKDLDYYIESSCDKHYNRKYVDRVCDPSDQRILPLLERDLKGTKANRTSKQKNRFQIITKLCGSNKGDVVKSVGFYLGQKQVVKNHIWRLGNEKFQQKVTLT